ncbi:MAG: hypothetical protein COB59_05315 [Rhodospirillaceae bacterium]|nr:MAG: hypothetical protein COB59_05315 [Rhodospirillaceae bacterium]
MANILIVDDDEMHLDIYEGILKDFGHDITFVTRGAVAIKTALANPPDLIIMDIQMPEMSGFEAMRLIRAEIPLKNIPILAATIVVDAKSYDEIYESGATGYISKPIDAKQLIIRIQEMLS